MKISIAAVVTIKRRHKSEDSKNKSEDSDRPKTTMPKRGDRKDNNADVDDCEKNNEREICAVL